MAEPVNQEPNLWTKYTFRLVASSTAGALAGWTFNLIHPMGGAIFGGVFAITDVLSENLLAYVFDDSAQGKALKIAFSLFANLVAATFITTLAGYTITVMSGIGLTMGMLAVAFAVGFLAHCCPCLKPLLGMKNDDQAQPQANPLPDNPPPYNA